MTMKKTTSTGLEVEREEDRYGTRDTFFAWTKEQFDELADVVAELKKANWGDTFAVSVMIRTMERNHE